MKKTFFILYLICHVSLSYAEDNFLQQAFIAYEKAQKTSEHSARLAYFNQAKNLFQAQLKLTNNTALYINMGNAALQAEDLGIAILAYRKALALEPSHQQAQQNLHYTQQLLPNWLPKQQSNQLVDSLFFWKSSLTTKQQLNIASISFFIICLFIAMSIFWKLSILRYLAILPTLLWLGLTVALLFDYSQEKLPQAIFTLDTQVYSADSINSLKQFPQVLPAGVEVGIVKQRGNWMQVNFADQRHGWVKTSHITKI